MRPAIQLFTLREMDADLPDLLARVGETEFEGVEFAGLGESDPEDVRAALDDAGLEAAGAHVGIEDLEAEPNHPEADSEDDRETDSRDAPENDAEAGPEADPEARLDEVAETYRRLDCERIVVPYLDEANFVSEEVVADTGRRLQELSARLSDRGIALGYHNHDHEFVALDGESAFERLADETDIDLELDVGWATAAGHDPTDLLAGLHGRVPLVHLKDVADDQPVELGEGDLDVEGSVRAAREAGTEWLVYEHDEPDDPEESLEHGAETLAELLD